MKWLKRLFKKKQVKVAETKQLNIPDVVLRSEQLPCGDCDNYAEYDGCIKYCSVCGTKLS